jgi:CheY-like chemotaxis protein
VTRKKILIVGNFIKTEDLESGILKRGDISVYSAFSGKQALEKHELEKFNLIVIGMGVTDPGPELLCSQIRSSRALSNVSIMIVGDDTLADRSRFIKCNANLYLPKPFTKEFFQQKAAEMLDVAPRVDFRANANIRVTSRVRSEAFDASTKNLSKSGMLLITSKRLFKDDVIECSLALASVGLISVKAKVVRMARTETDEYEYGIKFTKVAIQDMIALETFLSYCTNL